MTKKYTSIDIFKFIFSVCVIGLHTNLTNNFYIIKLIFRLAVPFFFISSGFFYYSKIKGKSMQEIKIIKNKYIKRLLYPLLFWSIITCFLYFIIDVIKGKSVIMSLLCFIRSLLFYPEVLWYVLALIIAIEIITDVILKGKNKLIFIFLLIIGYLFALINNNYNFIIKNEFIKLI